MINRPSAASRLRPKSLSPRISLRYDDQSRGPWRWHRVSHPWAARWAIFCRSSIPSLGLPILMPLAHARAIPTFVRSCQKAGNGQPLPSLRAESSYMFLEAYTLPRSKPIASTPDFPDYRGIQNIWNPKLGTFEKREMRLIALNNDEAAIAVHVLKFPNVFSSPSGFQFGSPRDKADFAIYPTYPKESGVSGLRSLDYAPSQPGSPQKPASLLVSIRQTVTIGPTRRFPLPDG